MKRVLPLALLFLLAHPVGAAAQDAREDVRRGVHEALGAALFHRMPLEQWVRRPDHGDRSDPGWLHTETPVLPPEVHSAYPTVLRTEPPDRPRR